MACKTLERGALSNEKVVELSAKFVCVKLHFGDNGEVAKTLNVSRPPNLRLVSAKGDTLKVFEGGASAEELVKAMEEALTTK